MTQSVDQGLSLNHVTVLTKLLMAIVGAPNLEWYFAQLWKGHFAQLWKAQLIRALHRYRRLSLRNCKSYIHN